MEKTLAPGGNHSATPRRSVGAGPTASACTAPLMSAPRMFARCCAGARERSFPKRRLPKGSPGEDRLGRLGEGWMRAYLRMRRRGCRRARRAPRLRAVRGLEVEGRGGWAHLWGRLCV